MNRNINLLFTNEKKYYAGKTDLLSWNYFLPRNLDECINFITIYQPKMILIDTAVDHRTLIECISKIKHTYNYSPVTIFAQKSSLLEIINTPENDQNAFVKTKSFVEIPIEIEKKLDYALAGFKFSASLKGYNYIKRCLFEGICNPAIFESIEKCLYNKVAEVYSTSKYSVERGINFSIRRAFLENPTAFNIYINKNKKPPSNGKFLKTLLIYIKYLDSTPKVQPMADYPVSKKEWEISYPDFVNNFF